MFRRVLIAAVVLLALVAAACSQASSTRISPCGAVRAPVWSPDGTQIAYYGTRWPPPPHAYISNNGLQAYCVADANGKNAQPLRYTVCSEKCPDFPYQITWAAANELLFLRDGTVYSIDPGSKPRKVVVGVNDESFAIDAAHDRIASGANFSGCVRCSGPVTVFDLATGKVVGRVGGKKLDNVFPSLSPDGSRVVFERDASNGSGKTFGIWTANADGSGLRRLEAKGFQPLWSPAGDEIAYRTSGYSSGLRVVASHGGKARTLVRRGVQNVFGWSPNGKYVAFESGSGTFGKLTIVNVATGKTRHLLQLYFSPTAAWSPDSTKLLADTWPKAKGCSALWRVSVPGGESTLLRHC